MVPCVPVFLTQALSCRLLLNPRLHVFGGRVPCLFTSGSTLARTYVLLGREPHALLQADPLPKKAILLAILLQICEAMSITILYSFVVFLVRDVVEDVGHHEGTYVGLLAGAYGCAQFLSSGVWGWLSDKIGRRKCLIGGTVGSMLASIVFGLSTTYTQAMVGRITAGMLNGNIGVLKSYLSDITTPSNRGKAFTVMPLAWGLGSVLGPVAGGLLSSPAKQYPNVSWGIFETYPYLLPIVGSLFVQTLALVSTICWMKDIRPDDFRELQEDDAQPPAVSAVLDADKDDVERPPAGSPSQQAGGTADLPLLPGGSPPLEQQCATPPPVVAAPHSVRNRTTLVASGVYATLGAVFVMHDEGFPLFAAAAVDHGGLGFSSSQIGAAVAIGGVALVLLTVSLVPKLLNRLGCIRALRISIVLVVFLFSSWGFSALTLNVGSWLLWAVLAVAFSCKAFLGASAFTAVMLAVNNSVPNHKIGAANGLAQSIVALARAVSPAAGGGIWSFASAHLGKSWAPHFLFGAMGVVLLLALALAYCLPPTVNQPYAMTLGAQPAVVDGDVELTILPPLKEEAEEKVALEAC